MRGGLLPPAPRLLVQTPCKTIYLPYYIVNINIYIIFIYLYMFICVDMLCLGSLVVGEED